MTVVEQFLNTLDERTFTWHGRKRVTLSAWLETHGLVTVGQQLHSSDLATTVALRTALRDALTDGTDGGRSHRHSPASPCGWRRARPVGCASGPPAAWPAWTRSSRRWPRAWPAAAGAG
ncbi:hypothetical protein [Actinoplanes sp. NPDC051411]|uniref:hypothetical protein n=1 Tax=Actinoplanes sp. NPDC051411 TaxID=3155522 RepID=UPI00343BBE8A